MMQVVNVAISKALLFKLAEKKIHFIVSVTGIDLHFITPIICAICVFYTTIGGLR